MRAATVYIKSLEAYDYHENKWSAFPSMLSATANHTAISISNKMFMMENRFSAYLNNFEVFVSVTRKLTSIKSLPKLVKYFDQNQTVFVGYTIYFFIEEENNEVKVHSYDIKNNVFSFKP